MNVSDDGKTGSSDDEPFMNRRDYIQMRLAQLAKQDVGITDQTDEDFLKRRSVIDDQFDKQIEALEQLYYQQMQSIRKRTIGDYYCLQSSLEHEIIDSFFAHFNGLFPSEAQLRRDYLDVRKKYRYLDNEMMDKPVYVDGKPVIDFWNVGEYNDAKCLRGSKVKTSPLPFIKIYGKKNQKPPKISRIIRPKRLWRKNKKNRR